MTGIEAAARVKGWGDEKTARRQMGEALFNAYLHAREGRDHASLAPLETLLGIHPGDGICWRKDWPLVAVRRNWKVTHDPITLLTFLLRLHGWSQRDLAQAVGMGQSSVARATAGGSTSVNSLALALERQYGVSSLAVADGGLETDWFAGIDALRTRYEEVYRPDPQPGA